jgi:transposase-like protein
MLRGIFPGETSMIRLMGSVLMEMHEKWMTGKNSFTMECYEADREEAKKAMQLDRNELNHTDQLTA